MNFTLPVKSRANKEIKRYSFVASASTKTVEDNYGFSK
jgi:hypothetical protein